MKLHRHSTVPQPRQKPMVKALAMALAVASGAASAIMPNANDAMTASGQQSQIAGKSRFLQDMSPSQRRSLYQNWLDSRRPPSEAGEIAALIDAWRHRHPASTLSPQGKLKFSPGIEATHVVQNCNDSGAGSLRAAVAAAGNSDTIDLSQLACSTITLTTGAISVLQNDLDIIGPGAGELAISGNNQSQVFGHSGSGTLSIDAVTIRNGFKYSDTADVYGGCIFSSGSVSVSNVEVRDCIAVSTADDSRALGGGVFAIGDISVTSSLITGNVAANKYDLSSGLVAARGGGLYARDGEAGIFDSLITNNDAYTQQPFNTFTAMGGGVSAGGGIEAKYSQFTHNTAGLGGGLDIRGNVVIAHSTISENDADFNAGAFFDGNATHTLSIRNSTVSGNDATSCAAGVTLSDFTQAWISSSTVTRNISEGDFSTCGSGVNLQQQIDELRLESTIIAGNTTNGGVPSDLRGTAVIPSIIGANNLVYESPLMLPPDTISLTPALLGPLAFNGGPTRTHALIEGSPALDAGNNVFNLISDQRGTGFPRVFGPQADIGAFETQGEGPIPDDRIFYNGFGFDEEFGGPGG